MNPTLRKFKASLGYIVKLPPQKTKQNKKDNRQNLGREPSLLQGTFKLLGAKSRQGDFWKGNMAFKSPVPTLSCWYCDCKVLLCIKYVMKVRCGE